MNKLLAIVVLCMSLVVLSTNAVADPDCTSPESWPTSMAFTYLKNAGMLNNEILDFKKIRVKRLASEKISSDRYRQVHLVSFHKKTGGQVTVITVNDASSDECSMSDTDVYVVSRQLGEHIR